MTHPTTRLWRIKQEIKRLKRMMKNSAETAKENADLDARVGQGFSSDSKGFQPSSSSSLSKEVEVEEARSNPKELFKPQTADEAFQGMTESRRKTWAELYPDPDYISRTVKRAFSYYFDDHPDELPKSRRGWSKAFGHWLETGWARHRAEAKKSNQSPSKNASGASQDAELEAGHILTAVKRFGAYNGSGARQWLGEVRWQWVTNLGGWAEVCRLPADPFTKRKIINAMSGSGAA